MREFSPSGRRCSLQLTLEIIVRKIASIEGSYKPEPGVFEEEHPGLRSLRERFAQLREVAAGTGSELLAKQRG